MKYLIFFSQSLSAFGLLAVAFHHLWCDALVLLHIFRHGLTNQLKDVLGLHAHGLSYLHCQHVQSQDGSSGDFNFGHHRLSQLDYKEIERERALTKQSQTSKGSLKRP